MVIKHSLKNALIPVVTILGIQLAQIFSGTVVIESIFGLPGIGRFLFDAILQRDYPVIQGINLLVVSIIVSMNLLVDLLYAVLDPRIRYPDGPGSRPAPPRARRAAWGDRGSPSPASGSAGGSRSAPSAG